MNSDFCVTREQVARALARAKDWLLQDQITPQTQTYDTFVETAPKQGSWTDAPLARHLVGGFYANLWRNPIGAKTPTEVRRQYHSTWHTAQLATALLDYLDYQDNPAVRKAVDLTWDFLQRHQLTDGQYKGVFIECEPSELKYPLNDEYSFSTQDPLSRSSYASYDNIETCLFPLELYRRTKNPKALQMASDTAAFYLAKHPDKVFFEIETHNKSISGMCNDGVYGRLAKYTNEKRFYDTFVRQIQRLNFLGLDLRAGNNVRNMYWDMTSLMYAVDNFPELFHIAMAKLAFVAEHTLAAQKDSGVLWGQFKRDGSAGVPDTNAQNHQDGAATNGAMIAWAKLYDVTGDPRWLTAIRKAVHYAVTHQYPADEHPAFAGAFLYGGQMTIHGHQMEMLRSIATAFGLRAMLPLLKSERRWAKDFWKQ